MLGHRERLVVKEQGLDLKCEGGQGAQQEREGVGFPSRNTGSRQGRPAPSIIWAREGGAAPFRPLSC